MRKVSATFIIPGNQPPLRNGILICNNDGTIIDLIDTKGNLTEQAGLEYYSGVIVPGFINAQCKLELSENPDQYADSEVFSNYLNNLTHPLSDFALKAISHSDSMMQREGIVAAGDISHSKLTLTTKKKSAIYYHTFIEAFGTDSSQSENIFLNAQHTEKEFLKAGLPVSITPHSSCSTSNELLSRILKDALDKRSILSVSNNYSTGTIQKNFNLNESDQLLQLHSDDLDQLQKNISFLSHPAHKNRLILAQDNKLKELDPGINKSFNISYSMFIALCPGHFIRSSGLLPKISNLLKKHLKICIGTGDQSSGHHWSILNELITLQEYFPELSLQQLVGWACINGAEALGIGSEMGSFEIGKNPGINLLTGVDLQQLKLKPDSKVKVLQKAQK